MRRRPLVAAVLALALLLASGYLHWQVPSAELDPTPTAEPLAASAPDDANPPRESPEPAAVAAATAPEAPTSPDANSDEDPLLRLPVAPGEALLLLEWCSGFTLPDQSSQMEQEWQWLGGEAAALERATHAAARAWAIEHCGPWTLDRGSDRAKALRERLLERARASADLQDRLRALANDSALDEPDAALVVEARRLLEQALLAGKPELLRDVGRALERSRMAMPDQLGPYAGGGASTLFTLLACDLGMPCGEHSEMLRLNCWLVGRCGYPDYETMAFDAFHGSRGRELIQAHRAELLRRIRAGEVIGLFDPLPLPGKP
jgi:hypothetical protein